MFKKGHKRDREKENKRKREVLKGKKGGLREL